MVSSTSKEVFHNEIKGNKDNSQNKEVFAVIKSFGRACTMREIQEKSGLEINVVSRTLNNLRTKLKVIDFFDAVSSSGGKPRKVHHYFIITMNGQVSIF